jgi:hypothetical protein
MSEMDYTQAERQRNSTAEHYQKFYIETPIEDLDVTVAAEAADVITVSGQVVDPAGDPIEEQMQLRMILFTDTDYDTLDSALTDVTVAFTTGLQVAAHVAGVIIDFLTDADGAFEMTFTDASDGTQTGAVGFVLPNGKFVPGGEITFVDDTP